MLEALQLPRRGKVISLESRWWRGMPVDWVHPPFEVVTYRTPRGVRNQGDIEFLSGPGNEVGFGFVSELVLGTTHSGTHIDALCHVTCAGAWHGGDSADEHLGDHGALSLDASQLPPIIARGVLFDIPALLGLPHLEPSFAVGSAELEAAAAREEIEVRAGDVALVRTGQMQFWPDVEAMAAVQGAGLSLDGARWLSQRGVVAVGADTVMLECQPSGVEGSPQPVHLHLIHEHGIPILEWVNCEQLAAEAAHEFLFCCLPLTVVGATGSFIRPVAII